ncbi:TonB-dependent receptor [Pseudoalteromonas sp. SMS1]|uniref:TonB-dependent receptor n=1 Tax=Pseudoalteromonas sp. SMS1 TaxID=2908894 RepID=UPI001F319A8D|nr:TonB-dependent receptor [Pseudoalteromonas sp. SMS1]MCF2858717.1 TonB-dependent receptor [Pseudoalteromonas sp. SMS1]
MSISSQVSVYYSELNSLIVRHGLQSFARTGAVKGAELTAKMTWGGLFARLGINDYRAEDFEMDNRVPASPRYLAQLRVSTTLTEGLDAGVSLRLMDKMYNSFSHCDEQRGCEYINPEKPYSDKAMLIDLSFTAPLTFGLPMTTQFGVKNVFGTHHTHPVSSNNAWLKQGFPAEARRVFMSFKYQL